MYDINNRGSLVGALGQLPYIQVVVILKCSLLPEIFYLFGSGGQELRYFRM